MKSLRVLLTSLMILSIGVPAVNADKSSGAKAQTIAKYDANKNGAIDADEVPAVQADFAKDPKGDLSRFDANSDGKLSTEEITAIRPGSSGKKKEKDGKKSGKE